MAGSWVSYLLANKGLIRLPENNYSMISLFRCRYLDIVIFGRRPVYHDLVNDLDSIGQIISVTGPRRVGKSTILKQIVEYGSQYAPFTLGVCRRRTANVLRGDQKFYPVDIALRNAVLRVGKEVLSDSVAIGLYAENLVFNALNKWHGELTIYYYRDAGKEVDFIVHTNPSSHLPVEVKYRNCWSENDIKGLFHFSGRYSCHGPAVVTKAGDDFGKLEFSAGEVFRIPLAMFLLLFD